MLSGRAFDRRELAFEQRGRRKMTLALAYAFGEQLFGSLQINEEQISAGGTPQALAISALERRAGDDDALLARKRGPHRLPDQIQPGHPILIGQRNAL